MRIIKIAEDFMNAYDAHDIGRMLSLCSADADFYYVPYGEHGKGSVAKDAKELWQTFTSVMPDFFVEIHSLMETIGGKVVVETVQGGTLQKDIMGIKANGRLQKAPHIFILSFEKDKISHIKCYWDNDTIYAQLGHTQRHTQNEANKNE